MVDTASIVVKAGNGGDGRVSFLRLKYMPKGGPDGGDGGDGGSIYLLGDKDSNTLRAFASKQRFSADPGDMGGKRNMHGKNAEDIYIKVPVGTIISQIIEDGTRVLVGEVVRHNQTMCIARGGRGGRGNSRFKSSTQTTPQFAEKGTIGEEKTLFMELKLLADVGFVGLPNAGKSTLLSVLTRATPEIGNYPFTTLFPNLGVMEKEGKTLVLADIPGLIEGAHEGKGLGQDFLRHIDRCKMLIFLLFVDDVFLSENNDVQMQADAVTKQYNVLIQELKGHRTGLEKKPSLIVVNKMDLYSEELQQAIQHVISEDILFISGATHQGIDLLKDRVFSMVS